MEVILAIGLFLVMLVIGMPISFSLFFVGLLGITLTRGLPVAMSTLGSLPYSTSANALLIVVPMFILTGAIAFAAGISRDAYDLAYRWLGRLPGGLGMATVAACAAFAATSGSSVATAATVGKVALPEMKRFGYSDSLATGTVAAGGLLGIMIPPSITLVIYGIVTETSIGKLLIAGILPGLMTALIFILGVGAIALRRPELAPRGSGFPWSERLRSLYKGWGVLVLFTVVIGGIYAGLFTASEAAAVGAVVALLMALLRRVGYRPLRQSFLESAQTTAMIFLILIGASIFNQFITITGVARDISTWITALPVSTLAILLIILVFYIPLGMFLDPISIMLITLPVIFPAVVRLGYDPVWFGVIITKMMEIAAITPPIGFNVYIIKGIAPEVALHDIFKGAGIFVIFELIALGLLITFPTIATFLPSQVE